MLTCVEILRNDGTPRENSGIIHNVRAHHRFRGTGGILACLSRHASFRPKHDSSSEGKGRGKSGIEERLGKPSFEPKRVNQAEIYDPTLTYSDLNVLNIFSYAS